MDEQKSTTESAPGPFMCTKCGEEKPAAAFSKRNGSPTGYRFQCKICKNTQTQMYNTKHPEQTKARQSRYCQKHPERVATSKATYCEKYPERVSTTQKASRKKHHLARAITN